MIAVDPGVALLELLARARRILELLPHVAGVGLGWREKCGEITDIPALRVYVRQKVARAELSQSDVIPAYYDGVLTDVVPVFTVVPAFATVAAMPHSSRAPLRPGI